MAPGRFTIIGIAVGAVGAVVLAPVALTAAGFTSAGIAAGSLAASMMSSAAIANGGAVATGSLVAILQSAGCRITANINGSFYSRECQLERGCFHNRLKDEQIDKETLLLDIHFQKCTPHCCLQLLGKESS
ncbi:interferon alpha-inducible protein 27-like protein 1 isoform X2 [Triplophysa dalaica]|uniref:interferon alpha-inducible protein 27-like protein 1 isoform X2 n=1 Tax=Triplophysa dalaica TaxID=1582913 RepID=UPI0024DF3B6E|nr:interferon alpha-inducible protein 27-like protein 1 isoform X2 [Triplophysa dalaica]